MPRLTILLGAGGVGKTTLASGLALAHARAGARVALLGVDPARRLRSALALAELPDHGARIPLPATGTLDAALLDPSTCLRRWVAEACPDDAQRARVLASPYFVALADRLAGFTDAIGCARAVEWAERDPALTELVLDTAPGVPAVELLSRPEKLVTFFDGPLVRWLVRLSRFGRSGLTSRGGRRMLAGLADLSGGAALRDVGELVAALDGAIATMVGRLERARTWLTEPATSLAIVCAVADDAAEATLTLSRAVRAAGFAPTLVAVNRVLAAGLATWSPPLNSATAPARAFARYVRAYLSLQQRVHAELAAANVPVIDLPDTAALDAGDRLGALTSLGEPLRVALGRSASSRAA